MKVTWFNIEGPCLIEPDVFEDERGSFYEIFNHQKFEALIGRSVNFVQDNQSKSNNGALRGLHFQHPRSQGKLIQVMKGEIFDIALDIRSNSPSYGMWISNNLSADNKKQLWIPEGFAHGFLTLSDLSEVFYKTTTHYAPEFEYSIVWNDPLLNITWPASKKRILSSKDECGLFFSEISKLK